jgi:hypothetical protein
MYRVLECGSFNLRDLTEKGERETEMEECGIK